MLFVAAALAYPTEPAVFPAIKGATLDGEQLELKQGSYTVIDSIRSAEW